LPDKIFAEVDVTILKICTLIKYSYEIAMVEKLQTGMKISPWLFHLTFKNKIIYR